MFINPVVIKPEDLRFLNAQSEFRAHNYGRAYLALLPMANAGDARAEYLLGVMSDNGLGPVQLDVAEAARWYQRAAEKNNADAAFALSNAYSVGRGVTVNPNEALKWLTRAAENGHVTAMMSLAGLYDTGVGRPRDAEKAAEWTLKAAQAGSVNALYFYGVRLMLGDGVAKDPQTAEMWVERAAQRGHPAAALMLGRQVGDGLKSTQDQNVQAFIWLTLATRRGQGQVRTDAAQDLRRLTPNMMPSDVQEAGRRVAAWRPMPQFAGLQPDPEYDLPGGLNNPTPPQPRNAAQGARPGGAAPAAGRAGGG
jgi:TPR repeat protein